MRAKLDAVAFWGMNGIAAIIFAVYLLNATHFARELFDVAPRITSQKSAQVSIYFGTALALIIGYSIPILAILSGAKNSRWERSLQLIASAELVFLIGLSHSYWAFNFFKKIRDCQQCDFEVSGINLRSNNLPTDITLTTAFGPGCIEYVKEPAQAVESVKQRTFFSKSQLATLVISKHLQYDSILLRWPQGGDAKCGISKTFESLSTARGIALGDAEEKVQKVYGIPSDYLSHSGGETAALYTESSDLMVFTFEGGRVTKIKIRVVPGTPHRKND